VRALRAGGRCPRLDPFLALALAALFVASGADLLLRTAALTELPLHEAWRHAPRVLGGSDYGIFWALRAAAILALAVLWWLRRQRSPLTTHAAGAATVLLTALVVSATGHAGENGPFTLFALSNTLHVAAGCLWGGMIIVYAFALAPHMRGGRMPAAIVAESAQRLSTLAALALAIVLATGIYNAWMLLGGVEALWNSDYGRLLLLKLLLVALMMAVGLHNRGSAVPAIVAWAQPPQLSPAADAPLGRLQRLLQADTLFFLLVLLCAAALGNTTPASHL
jgi:putative copper export protein